MFIFTKEEVDEMKDAIEDSLKYYQDLLDDAPSNPEAKKMNVEWAIDNKSITGFATLFGTSSSTQFMRLPSASNSQPLIIPS